MMTARKAGDGIDAGFFYRLGKLLPVKLFPASGISGLVWKSRQICLAGNLIG